MGEIADILISWAVTTAAIFALLSRDERRLSPDALARAWPEATKRVAVVFGGVLCLPIHFIRTRRSAAGVDLALVWMIVVALLSALASAIVEWAFGIDG